VIIVGAVNKGAEVNKGGYFKSTYEAVPKRVKFKTVKKTPIASNFSDDKKMYNFLLNKHWPFIVFVSC
jgi:hypothetical protein